MISRGAAQTIILKLLNDSDYPCRSRSEPLVISDYGKNVERIIILGILSQNPQHELKGGEKYKERTYVARLIV